MSLLQALLDQEAATRSLVKAVKDDELAQARRVVKAIHDVYGPYEPELTSLSLTGDYGAPVPVPSDAMNESGLRIALGSRISPQQLTLAVHRREGNRPLTIQLSIKRRHPYKDEPLQTFPQDTSPEHMVKETLLVLMKHIHRDSLAKAKAAAAS